MNYDMYISFLTTHRESIKSKHACIITILKHKNMDGHTLAWFAL